MKFKFLALLIACSALVCLPAFAHDFHTSITDISYNPRTKSLEVSLKVFTDDLETALSKFTKTKIVYDSRSDKQKQQLLNYLNQHVGFEVTKGKPLAYKVLGSEPETDAVWIYLEVPVQYASLKQLFVKNSTLTDLFSDQMNIVNINYKGKTESMLLQRGETVGKISF
jgi:hypothetical protein